MKLLIDDKDLENLHWMARRYCDGRHTYVTSMFNEITRRLLSQGVILNGCDKIIWARDGSGRAFDKLSTAEATEGTPQALGIKDTTYDCLVEYYKNDGHGEVEDDN